MMAETPGRRPTGMIPNTKDTKSFVIFVVHE
jgi:hypothetical protein